MKRNFLIGIFIALVFLAVFSMVFYFGKNFTGHFTLNQLSNLNGEERIDQCDGDKLVLRYGQDYQVQILLYDSVKYANLILDQVTNDSASFKIQLKGLDGKKSVLDGSGEISLGKTRTINNVDIYLRDIYDGLNKTGSTVVVFTICNSPKTKIKTLSAPSSFTPVKREFANLSLNQALGFGLKTIKLEGINNNSALLNVEGNYEIVYLNSNMIINGINIEVVKITENGVEFYVSLV